MTLHDYFPATVRGWLAANNALEQAWRDGRLADAIDLENRLRAIRETLAGHTVYGV